jgi:Na+-translocating ferredoxin:NAD+ oxidoreductase RnfG subunit
MEATIIVALCAAASAIGVAIINAIATRKHSKSADVNALKSSLDQHIKLDEVNAESVDKRFATLERHSMESYKAHLWENMKSADLSLEEKAEAAQKYIDAGYNGTRKVFAQSVVDAYRKSLEVGNG